MWLFHSHIRGIAFAKTGSHRHFAGAFLDRLERELTRRKARRIVRSESGLAFSAGMIRPVSSVNPLALISDGRIEVQGEHAAEVVHYHIGFGQLLVASLVLLALATPTVWSALGRPRVQRLLMLGGSWLLVFGMNFLMGVAGFKSMIQAAGRYRYAEGSEPETVARGR